MHSLSSNSYLTSSWFSLGKYQANPRLPLLLGIIVNLSKGMPPSRNQLVTACPLSCIATVCLSYLDNMLFFSIPAITLSVAISKSCLPTYCLLSLLAQIAASLQRLAIYAPLNPGVRVASLLAYYISESEGSNLSGKRCTQNISFLLSRSGRSTAIYLSNLPGLSNAGSSNCYWFVAARIITSVLESKPSISTNNQFRVFSRSWFLPRPLSLFLPIASISSINIIQGYFLRAYLKRSLTLAAPTPTNISTKSLPLK